MADWIKERAQEIRNERATRKMESERDKRYRQRALETISTVWPALVEEVKRETGRFNEEFPDEKAKIERVEFGPEYQVIIERTAFPAVTVEADFHPDEPYISIRTIQRGHGYQPTETKDLLYFNVTPEGKPKFGSSDTLPLTVEDAVRRLVEPFFAGLI